MPLSRRQQALHTTSEDFSQEVAVLADAVGNSKISLIQVMQDFLSLVPNPIIAGGFAMAHHGSVRATVDIDVLAIGSIRTIIEQFKKHGYKHESLQLPIGALDLLTKGNKGVDFIHLKNLDFLQSIENRAVDGLFLKQPVRFVSLEDLIILKNWAIQGRKKKQDEADLEVLLTNPHDTAYVKTWLKKLKL